MCKIPPHRPFASELTTSHLQTAAWPSHKRFCSRMGPPSVSEKDNRQFDDLYQLWFAASSPEFTIFLRSALQLGRPSSLRKTDFIEVQLSSFTQPRSSTSPHGVFGVETVARHGITEGIESARAATSAEYEGALEHMVEALGKEGTCSLDPFRFCMYLMVTGELSQFASRCESTPSQDRTF